MPRIMRDLAADIKIMQYDENMTLESVKQKEQKNKSIYITKSMIQQARENAEQIINEAKEEAQTYIAQVQKEFIESIEKEKQEMLDNAYEEGFSQGHKIGFNQGEKDAKAAYEKKANELSEEVFLKLQNSLDALSELQMARQEQEKGQVTELVMALCKKIINVKISKNNKLLLEIFENTLTHGEKYRMLRLKIGTKYFEISKKWDRELIDIFEKSTDNFIIEQVHDGPEDTCLLESDDKVIDLSVDTQLLNAQEIIKNHLNEEH